MTHLITYDLDDEFQGALTGRSIHRHDPQVEGSTLIAIAAADPDDETASRENANLIAAAYNAAAQMSGRYGLAPERAIIAYPRVFELLVEAHNLLSEMPADKNAKCATAITALIETKKADK